MKSIEIQKGRDLVVRNSTTSNLLVCGVFASLLYVAMNITCAMQYPGYSSASQTVSELSAIDAPTRPLWVILAIVYSVASIGFGLGLWQSGALNRKLQVAGTLVVINSIIGLFWPPMHQREVLAAGGGTLTDTLHILFSVVAVSPGPVTISGSCRYPFSGMLPAVCSLGLSNEGSGPVHFHSQEPCFVFMPSGRSPAGV